MNVIPLKELNRLNRHPANKLAKELLWKLGEHEMWYCLHILQLASLGVERAGLSLQEQSRLEDRIVALCGANQQKVQKMLLEYDPEMGGRWIEADQMYLLKDYPLKVAAYLAQQINDCIEWGRDAAEGAIEARQAEKEKREGEHLTGAWIETSLADSACPGYVVVAWIETCQRSVPTQTLSGRPIRGHGLKRHFR